MVLVPQSVSYLDPLYEGGGPVRNGHGLTEIRTRSREVLGSRYGLGRIRKGSSVQLSGGMTRRVLISAVMEKPELVIADEPTPGLHQCGWRGVAFPGRLRMKGREYFLLITHDLEHLAIGGRPDCSVCRNQ